jgi:Protein of unknown function (DUF3168)
MASDTQILQQAIFTHLTADTALTGLLGGAKVHDRPPEGAAMPYVTLGMTRAFDAGTASEKAQEHLFTLHAWSSAGGRKETMTILEALRSRMESLPVVNGAMRIVAVRLQGEDIVHDPDLRAFHGTLRFRAVTEPAAL